MSSGFVSIMDTIEPCQVSSYNMKKAISTSMAYLFP